MIKTLRKIILVLWIVTTLSLGYWISLHREYLEPHHLLHFFQSFGVWAIWVYIIVSFLRWLLLLPSLPLVLVGVLFFPDNLHLVFLISMLGIVFSWVLIYQFSDVMGFDDMFDQHVHGSRLKNAIEKYGFYAVILWSFVPVVPTDLISYMAGAVRMPFWRFVIALTIGESLIVGIIVYGGREMMKIFGL